MTSFVYFVSDGASAIKIGYSADVQRRLASLAKGSARGIKLLGLVEGERSQERALHQHLAAHRMSGEWFEDCGPVRAIIEEILQGGLASSGFAVTPTPVADLPTLAEAKKLADVVVRCLGLHLIDGPGEVCGVPRQLLWRLKYRPGRDVYADELTALRNAALQATEVALNRAAEDRRWVIDLCLDIEASRLRDDHLNAILRDLEDGAAK